MDSKEMAENSSERTMPEATWEDYLEPPPPEIDGWLGRWVQVVNTTSITFGITLSMNGVILSGTLVGWREYFQGVADDLRATANGQPELVEIVASSHEEAMKLEDESRSNESQKDLHPSYVHLKNARFINLASSHLAGSGFWWRGRLTEVDGFFIGELGITGPR